MSPARPAAAARPPFMPPVRVALARPVRRLPRGELAYEPKFDGHRLVVFRTGGDVLLQARSGRIVNDAFPDLAAAAEALPPGSVLDGEVVVWTGGRTDFAAVQRRALAGRSRAASLARRLPASYAAFDLLADGSADLRPLPYEERRARLLDLLAPLGPPLQPVPMTTDPELAAVWYETLPETGVEGLVAKGLGLPYRGGHRDWQKLRHSDTRDALVVGVIGPRARPRALVLVLPDDDTPVVSDPLDPAVRAQLAPALTGAESGTGESGTGETRTSGGGSGTAPDGTPYDPVDPALTVEILWSDTRHASAAVTRLRLPGHE